MLRDASWAALGSPPLHINQLEPQALIGAFLRHPPQGFAVLRLPGQVPGFAADFDLLTTADDDLKHKLKTLPGFRRWGRWLTVRTAFVGTTVSEYAVVPVTAAEPAELARALRAASADFKLLIVKDLPCASPLLDDAANAHAESMAKACEQQDFVLVEGQQLAYVPLDFGTCDEYLARLSASRRKNIRRKLRSRDALDIRRVATGDPQFLDPAVVAGYYAMYLGVYEQSEVHFDLLTPAFFETVLRDAASGGMVFEYRHAGELVGYNICFECDGKLIDKYVGFLYPQARDCNLYVVSWFVNLEYALARGLSHYVAGWTDPQVKSDLGASFTPTRHAVYVRNPMLRALARRFAGRFESDRHWREQQA